MTDFLTALKAAHEKATPGPWWVNGTGGIHMDGTRDGYEVHANERGTGRLMRVATGSTVHGPEADLIVLLRNAAPELTALVEAAQYALRFTPTYPERSPGWVAYAALRTALDGLEKGDG